MKKKQINEKVDVEDKFKYLGEIPLIKWEEVIQELIVNYGEKATLRLEAGVCWGYYNDVDPQLEAEIKYTRDETDTEYDARIERNKKAKVSARKRKLL
ncbi:hypothetical protein HN682_08795 [Candidatus Peregrinibacteria bacterium]|jgi:hypothetical protein|nr:hypothetical protein [Candidatus Peregrinibacteria bacterium]